MFPLDPMRAAIMSNMQGKLSEREETIRFMAENAHQAYHQDCACGWWECRRNICNAAQQALPDLVKKLRGPDHL